MSSSKYQRRLVALLSTALLWPLSACSHSAVSEGAPEAPVVPAAKVVRTDLRTSVTLTAEFEPFYEVDVMAKEAGYIRHMLVQLDTPDAIRGRSRSLGDISLASTGPMPKPGTPRP